MDAAFICRAGENEELKYALRSGYVNAGVRNVWIIGDAPSWYTGPLIKGNRHATKQRNVYDNLRILSEHPDLPERVAVWNDDFFALEPVSVEMAWRCTLDEHLRILRSRGWWWQSLRLTRDYLRRQGHKTPRSYELHRPFPIVRADMARILAEAADLRPDNPPQWRTLYGNLAHAGGAQDHDGKVYGAHTPTPSGPWMSSTDRSFGSVQRQLRRTFPRRSPWER